MRPAEVAALEARVAARLRQAGRVRGWLWCQWCLSNRWWVYTELCGLAFKALNRKRR